MASDRSREGTGLGLTPAKRFVELNGGRRWLESAVGKGTTFAFALGTVSHEAWQKEEVVRSNPSWLTVVQLTRTLMSGVFSFSRRRSYGGLATKPAIGPMKSASRNTNCLVFDDEDGPGIVFELRTLTLERDGGAGP